MLFHIGGHSDDLGFAEFAFVRRHRILASFDLVFDRFQGILLIFLQMGIEIPDFQAAIGPDHIAAPHVAGRTVAAEDLLPLLNHCALEGIRRNRNQHRPDQGKQHQQQAGKFHHRESLVSPRYRSHPTNERTPNRVCNTARGFLIVQP